MIQRLVDSAVAKTGFCQKTWREPSIRYNICRWVFDANSMQGVTGG
jgi:hypothetical protein